MNMTMTRAILLAAMLLTIAAPARGGDGQGNPAQDWLALAAADSGEKDDSPHRHKPVEPAEWTKPIPISFNLSYTLISDYIFRGINFSEYSGEGREKPNHQTALGVEYDTGKFGSIGACFWFEWYAAQEKLTPDYGGNTQEIDYMVYWKYAIPNLATTVETGWIAYTFPPLKGDAHTDYEWYLKVSFDDSGLWKTAKPVLNPYVAYYHDLDLAKNASWWEMGISHGFAMGDYFKDAPILKDITVTPSLVLGVNRRYYEKIGLGGSPSTRLANLNYGLEVSYDLSGAIKLPPQAGKMTVGGLLNYSQALYDELINDEFYGGLKLSYAW